MIIFNCFLFLKIWFLLVFCLPVCVCTMYISSVHGSQKRVLNSLEPKLQTVVSHSVGVSFFFIVNVFIAYIYMLYIAIVLIVYNFSYTSYSLFILDKKGNVIFHLYFIK